MQKSIVVVVPAYNCEQFVEKNLESIFAQQYSNFCVIYIDDCSTDATLQQAKLIGAKYPFVPVKYIENKERKFRTENVYNAVHGNCSSDAIVVLVDGDDWLPHDTVLQRLNKEYHDPDVWLTMGGYGADKTKRLWTNLHYTREAILQSKYRLTRWTTPHLVTFYAWLFFLIKKEDFQTANGTFMTYS